MLAPLQRQLRLRLAVRALEPQHHLLGRLGLFVEDGLCLPAVAGLLAVIAALALGDGGGLVLRQQRNRASEGGWVGALCSERVRAGVLREEREERKDGEREKGTHLAGFILRDLVLGVLAAFLAFAVGAAGFGDLGSWPVGLVVVRWMGLDGKEGMYVDLERGRC